MSNQLWSDLLSGSGGQFWSDLDSAPGIITPAPATLTLFGRDPAAAQQVTVFRTPATAVLTLAGLSLSAPIVLTPAPAALAYVGQIPARQLIRTITNALPAAVENPPAEFVPTLITIWTTQPGVASVTLQVLPFNLTQGGNIGFVSPAAAQISLGTLPYTLLYGEIGVGLLTVVGLAPTLQHELTITPDVGMVSFAETPPLLTLPFIWVDDDPAPTSAWITDVAA